MVPLNNLNYFVYNSIVNKILQGAVSPFYITDVSSQLVFFLKRELAKEDIKASASIHKTNSYRLRIEW